MTTENIIAAHTGLIYEIARRYFYGVEREDLFQAGVVGILKAYKNYKESSAAKFSSYAFKSIFGEMYKLVMQKQLKVSKDYLKLYKLIETTRYSLAQKLGHIPTDKEVALFLEKDIWEIEEAIMAGSVIVSSLDKASLEDRSIYETVPMEQSLSLEERLMLSEGLEQLSDEERTIIEYRYFEDLTQSEVARKLKKNQTMISRCESKVMNKMREFYAA